MRTNHDKAIAYGLTRPRIIKTFHKNTKVLDNGCIVWTKGTNKKGYGRMGIGLKQSDNTFDTYPVYVHRFAWALKHGMDALPISHYGKYITPDNLVLNHLCFNSICVNTNHLEVITRSENSSPEKKRPKDA